MESVFLVEPFSRPGVNVMAVSSIEPTSRSVSINCRSLAKKGVGCFVVDDVIIKMKEGFVDSRGSACVN